MKSKKDIIVASFITVALIAIVITAYNVGKSKQTSLIASGTAPKS